MDITEKWLGEIGGWAAMKAARALVQAGAVADASIADGLVQATVGAGKTKFRAGLKISGKSDVRNLCTCPASRGRGVICEHSLAAALVAISPAAPVARAPQPSTAAPASPPRTGSGSKHAEIAAGRFEVFLPESLFDSKGMRGGRVVPSHSVFLRFFPQADSSDDPVTAAANARLARWLAEQGVRPATTPLALDGRGVTGLLMALGEHPSVFLGRPGQSDLQPLAILAEPSHLPVVFEELPAPDGSLQARAKRSEQTAGLATGSLERGQGAWFFCRETAAVFRTAPLSDSASAELLRELSENAASAPRSAAWLVEHREALDEVLQITLDGPVLARLHVLPVPCEIELSLDGSLQAVVAKLEARFGEVRWPLSAESRNHQTIEPRFPIQNEQLKSIFYTRNKKAEANAIEELEDLGFVAGSRGEWVLSGRAAVLRFYGSDLPRLRRTILVREGDRWRASTRQLRRISPRIERDKQMTSRTEAPESRDWLSFEIAYEAPDGFRVPRGDVLRMIRAGQRSTRGAGGLEYVLDEEGCQELEESLQDIQVQMTATGGRTTPDHVLFLENQEHQSDVKTNVEDLIPIDKLKFLLSDIAGFLRPYQEAGIRWLEARIRSGRGALLADDMGLGKTLQAIATLRLVRGQTGDPGPILVLCPKTLIENWRSELARFAPDFRVHCWAGANRFDGRETAVRSDVIIAPYSLISSDLEFLSAQEPSALVLDEASFIRNPDTEVARAVFQLRSPRRIALSGTPIENGVLDIWSIMQFLAPGYLGPRKAFQERFEKPIQDDPGARARSDGKHPAQRLRRLISPFYLRREKQEVLPELPEKIEKIHWCDLSRPQMEVYRRLLEEGREEVRQARRRSNGGGAKLTMFTVLLRLRQACCDLRLLGLPEQVIRSLEPDDCSGKLVALREIMDLQERSGGKVLIFSQFTEFLRQARNLVSEIGIGHSYLDGSSEDRADQVRAFKEDPRNRVFLISLKAGGYGLNLAEADQVILMDPWWNPAVEAQAIDRAHRFGQDRVVTATRMIVRGTVEEKILKLQQSKRGLVSSVIETTSGGTGGLTADDLEELME